MINERFADLLEAFFSQCLGFNPISSFSRGETFEEYAANIDGFMSMNISRMEELRGNMMMVIDPSFISILTNAYYGVKLSP